MRGEWEVIRLLYIDDDRGLSRLIEKELGQGSLHLGGPSIFFFDLQPEDTDAIPAGNHYHEAEIITYQGRVYTVMVGSLRIEPQLIPAP